MNTRLLLRNLLEPVYSNHTGFKQQLQSVQGGLDRLRTGASERFPALIRAKRRNIYLTLTSACNLRCKGCKYGRDFMPNEQLSLQMVREVLEDAKEADFEIVRLYGGEPLVHKNIVDDRRGVLASRVAVVYHHQRHRPQEKDR